MAEFIAGNEFDVRFDLIKASFSKVTNIGSKIEYDTFIEGGNDIAAEDFDKYGINDSLTHVDFMVGSADLDIVGITHDGEEIQIFKDGNWAF